MAGSVITESDAFPTTLTAPNPTEPASATSLLSEFLQGAANRTRWLFNRVNVFVSGGTLNCTGSMGLTSNTSGVLSVNDLVCDSNADGGGVHAVGANGLRVSVGGLTVAGGVTISSGPLTGLAGTFTGRVRAAKGAVIGGATATTFTYDCSSTDHVYNGTSAATGCAWQIGPTVPTNPEVMRFVNFNANPIALLDPSGSLIVNLKYVAGFQYGITVAYISGAWTQIDANVHN